MGLQRVGARGDCLRRGVSFFDCAVKNLRDRFWRLAAQAQKCRFF
jgi:hypothetical protein